MKTGLSLQELAAELERQRQSKRDFVVDSANMGISATGRSFNLYPISQSEPPEMVFDMTNLFHSQLGSALGIPAKYYDRMLDGFPTLLAENVNGWLSRSPKKHTIRTLDGRARAFLSDRYRRIDNYEIAEAVLPVIGEMPDARVESCEITETRMYIKVVNPRLEAEVMPGDIVQAGVVISNSEVGVGSVTVRPLVYRLVCKNGMIVNDLGTRKYHVGRTVEESWDLFSDETQQTDDRAFMMKLADIVRTAADEARFAMVLASLREASGAKMTGRVRQVVELTGKQFDLQKPEENRVLRYLIRGGELSKYGLANAVTQASQDTEDYDRATALENTGWQIAVMPPQIWKQFNTEEAAPLV